MRRNEGINNLLGVVAVLACVFCYSSCNTWKPSSNYRQDAIDAIMDSDTNMLYSLLDRGVAVNEPLDDMSLRLYPLHYAVSSKSTNIVIVLANSGADLHIRNSLGERPIDFAYASNDISMCKLLTSLCSNASSTIAGCPIEILEHIFRAGLDYQNKEAILDIHGLQASDELFEWIKEQWPKIRKKELASDPDTTKENVFSVEIKKLSGNRYEYKVMLRSGVLSGFFECGYFEKHYNHWFKVVTDGGMG